MCAGWPGYFKQEGIPLTGFDGLVHSTMPFSSGLSSSAALEMAAGVLFQQVSGFQLDPVRLALLDKKPRTSTWASTAGSSTSTARPWARPGQRAPARLPQPDQPGRTPSRMGSRWSSAIHARSAAWSARSMGNAGRSAKKGCAFCSSFTRRSARCGISRWNSLIAHRAELPEVVARRCRFIIEENQRVLDLAEALSTGNRPLLAALLVTSYGGARDLFEIGAPAMEAMMEP